MRTGPHDYGPREWGGFLILYSKSIQKVSWTS